MMFNKIVATYSLDCVWLFLDKNLKYFLEARFMYQGQERIKSGIKSLHSFNPTQILQQLFCETFINQPVNTHSVNKSVQNPS